MERSRQPASRMVCTASTLLSLNATEHPAHTPSARTEELDFLRSPACAVLTLVRHVGQPMPVTAKAVVQLRAMALRAEARVMVPLQTAFFSLVSTPSLLAAVWVP